VTICECLAVGFVILTVASVIALHDC